MAGSGDVTGPVPQDSQHQLTHWIQYYLDDFDAPEIVHTADIASLQGTVSELQRDRGRLMMSMGWPFP